MNYYQAYGILGLAPGAPLQEVKSAYRRLAKSLHPDNHPRQTEAERERYRSVTEAYAYLEQLLQDGSVYVVPTGGASTGAAQQTTGGAGGAAYAGRAPGARVIGSPVAARPGSSLRSAERKRFEERYQQESMQRKARQREEVARRSEELKEQKEQAQKERQILNEIRMIRLAHIIQATIAAEQKKDG